MPATIGILAGMGPRSTGPFIDLVLDECQLQYGARHDVDFPKILICSQPVPFYEDRENDEAAIFHATREGLQHLDRAGADFMAIACNTAHIFYHDLARSVTAPLLNMVELAVAAVPATSRNVALVAARPTVEAGIFQSALAARGYSVAAITWQAAVDRLLGETRDTKSGEVFTRRWAEIFQQVEPSGADTALVACLDLTGVLQYAETHLHLVDAAKALAREVVRQWRDRGSSGRVDRKVT